MAQTPVCVKINVMGDLWKLIGDYFKSAIWGPLIGVPKNLQTAAQVLSGNGTGNNTLDSAVNQITQAGPTGRDLWLANREDTANQRAVADMEAAGLNKALLYGSSGGQPAASSVASGQGMSLSDLLQFAMMPAQLKLAESQGNELDANAENQRADAAKKRAELPWVDKVNEASVRSQNASANLNEAKVGEVEQSIKTGKAQTEKLLQEAKTEEKKRELLDTQIILNNANAHRIEALLPFEQLLMEASSESQRAEAGYKLVQTAYQQRLIDSDYIDSIIKSAGANATVAQVEAYLSSGDYTGGESEGWFKEFMHRTIAGINNAIRVVSPIKSVSSVTIGKQ